MPDPPYYAVIFSAQRTDVDEPGYAAMATKMAEMALAHPGCIGMESTRNETGFGITVSYWRDAESVLDWKANTKHLVAQKLGKDRWYKHFRLRVALIERHYDGP